MENNNVNDDILAILDEEEVSLDLTSEDDKISAVEAIKKESPLLKIKEWFIFWVKYIATTSLIFAVLLWAVNYNAYFQIVDSHLNKAKYEDLSNSLKASVIDASFAQKVQFETERSEINTLVRDDEKKEIISQIQDTTFHSMRKLEIASKNENVSIDIDVVPFENRIIIPNIGKNIPLVEVRKREAKNPKELENIFMDELAHGVVRYPWSSTPWKEGNTFIFGHSSNFPWAKGEYNEVFAKLDDLEYGNKIYVYYNQKKYTYKVTKKQVIDPKDVKILKRDAWKQELTLMTCFPIGTTLNRMIVIAELIEE